MPAQWTAIVLAGGRSSRLGSDKVQAVVDERRLIDHVLAGLPPDTEAIVVGPDPQSSVRSYAVTREPEPGSGPVAAIAAGLELATTPLVVVIAADMPFAGSLLVALTTELEAAPPDVDAVIPVDAGERRQPLAAAYRAAALRGALERLGPAEGRSVRDLISGLNVRLRAIVDATALLDVDTPDDLDAARRSVPFSTDG